MNPDWQMTKLFLLALAVMGLVMKLAALLLPAKGPIERRAMSWVLVSPDSVLRSQRVTSVWPVVLRALLLSGAVVVSYWVYWQLVTRFQLRGILLSYLAGPILLLVMEAFVALESLIFLPSGYLLPALHHRPLAARSVADFWGNRWNRWFNDWFRYVLFGRMRGRPVFALFLIFAVSGLLHEWGINFPFYWLTGKNLLGTMMLYFLLQPAGILIERRFLKGHPRAMVLFAWLMVYVPSPLVLNEAMLRVVHLWPE